MAAAAMDEDEPSAFKLLATLAGHTDRVWQVSWDPPTADDADDPPPHRTQSAAAAAAAATIGITAAPGAAPAAPMQVPSSQDLTAEMRCVLCLTLSCLL